MSYYTIQECSFEDFTKEEQDEWCLSNNGYGREPAGYLVIRVDDKIVRVESDAMEPEDATFGRDLHWIGDALAEAFKYGQKLGVLMEVDKIVNECLLDFGITEEKSDIYIAQSDPNSPCFMCGTQQLCEPEDCPTVLRAHRKKRILILDYRDEGIKYVNQKELDHIAPALYCKIEVNDELDGQLIDGVQYTSQTTFDGLEIEGEE